jgi:hypothetical protein
MTSASPRTPQQRKKLISRIQNIMIGLCVVTVLCIPLVVTYGPGLARKYRAGKATSNDPQTRLIGLNYIIRNAPRDKGTRQAAVQLMADSKDDANFTQIMRALDVAGVWNRDTVPAPIYLRWLGMLAKDPNPVNRTAVSQYVGELSDIADDFAVSTLMSLLIADTDDQTRYAALVACADLAHAGKNPAPYIALIKDRTTDPNKKVAQQAWIMLGCLKAADTLPPDLTKLPDTVAQAAAWALIISQAKGAEEAVQAIILDPKASLTLRTSVVYALHNGTLPSTPEALQRLLSRLQSPGNKAAIAGEPETFHLAPPNAWLLWRAVLAFPGNPQLDPALLSTTSRLVAMQGKLGTKDDPAWNMLLSAAYYRNAGPRMRDLDQSMSVGNKTTVSTDRSSSDVITATTMQLPSPMFSLASLEGMFPGALNGARPTSEMPDAFKLALLRASGTIQESDIYPLLSHDAAYIRDQACIIAWQNMPKEAQSNLVAKLLKDYNDNAKMSGGFLAGLTNTQSELLARRARDEDVWAVQQILRLGLFMQAPGYPARPYSQDHDNLRALLMRPDLPRSTITLGLLFKHDDGPLEFLFNPKGEPYLPLVEMFDDKRWWHALQPFMPQGMPGFEVWADPGLMAFQIDLMRNWYLVNKRKLTWPAPQPSK